jgi:hypothetical protein
MPITPYSTPIEFEYKPLGLEGFAKPLSEMQNQYDDTLNKVDALDFDIQALSKDDPAAKEKINALMEKRNQLRDSLMNTKNFKQGARKILDLNREYTKDEDIQSIQSNAKRWQEYDKLEKERYLKGDISREEYESNRAVRMGEYAGYKEGSIDTIPLSKNEEENIRKDVDNALKAAAEQTKYTYNDGFDEVTNKKIRLTVENKFLDKNQIAQEVYKHILTSDKYKEFYNSRADLTWRKYKLSGKEEDIALSTYQSDIQNTTRKISDAQSELDKYTKLKEEGKLSPEDAKIIDSNIKHYENELTGLNSRLANVQGALESGNVDTGVAKRMFEDQFLESKVGQMVNANADIYDYDTTKQNLKYEAISDSSNFGTGNEANALTHGTIIPSEYVEDITAKSLGETLFDVRKSMTTTLADVETTSKSFGKLYEGKNKIAKTHMLSNIGIAISNSKNYDEFSKKMKEYDPSFDADAAESESMYESFNSDNGRANLKQYINKLGPEASKLEYTKSIYNNAKKQIKQSNEYKVEMNDFQNKKLQVRIGNDYSDKAKEEWNTVVNYLAEKNDVPVSAFKYKQELTDLNLKDLSEAFGYDNVEEALDNGMLNKSFFTEGWNKKIHNDYADIINPKLDEKLKNTPFISNFVITGNDKDAKELKSQVTGVLDAVIAGGAGLEKMTPVFGAQWKDTPGFNEEGRFIGKVISEPTLGFTDQGIIISTPISYKEGDEVRYKTIYSTFPNNNKLIEREMLDAMIKNSSSESPKDISDRAMMYAAKFNTYRPDNTLTPTYADAIEVTENNPATIYEFQEGAFKFKVVKEGLADKKDKGPKNSQYVIKYYNPNTTSWSILKTDEGKEKLKTINDVRTLLGEKLYAVKN